MSDGNDTQQMMADAANVDFHIVPGDGSDTLVGREGTVC